MVGSRSTINPGSSSRWRPASAVLWLGKLSQAGAWFGWTHVIPRQLTMTQGGDCNKRQLPVEDAKRLNYEKG